MSPEEAISIALEQVRYWRDRGVNVDTAMTMLTGNAHCGHSGGWERVTYWMIRWLLRKREDEERWAA